jgi:plasmid maintenance system antidote protein VapI
MEEWEMAEQRATKVLASETMQEFLLDRYEARKKDVRLTEKRVLSQNEYAQREIGMVPMTYSRYLNGDRTMTMDQAVLLIKFYGSDILPHFQYGMESSLTKLDAQLLALAAEDEDTGRALAALAKMRPEQRQAAAGVILRMERGEQGTNNTFNTVTV